jgi:hypothetical protein
VLATACDCTTTAYCKHSAPDISARFPDTRSCLSCQSVAQREAMHPVMVAGSVAPSEAAAVSPARPSAEASTSSAAHVGGMLDDPSSNLLFHSAPAYDGTQVTMDVRQGAASASLPRILCIASVAVVHLMSWLGVHLQSFPSHLVYGSVIAWTLWHVAWTLRVLAAAGVHVGYPLSVYHWCAARHINSEPTLHSCI